MNLRIRLWLPAAILVLAGSCGDPTAPEPPRTPASLDIISGNTQDGVVGQELAEPLVVRVLDAQDRPVAGQILNFRVTSGGGSVFAGAAMTNADGVARERWTLGTVARDTQQVEVRAVDPGTGEPIVFATFTAVGTADAPDTLTALAPLAFTGPAGEPLGDSASVRVRDRYGNAVPGATVAWTVTDGGGSVAPATSTSDSLGVARAAWTLGPAVDDVQVLRAATGALTVDLSGTTTVPTTVTLSRVSGDGQADTVATMLDEPVVVRVTDRNGAPLANVPVTWSPGSGTADPAADTTDAAGLASARWTLGTVSGTQYMFARVAGRDSIGFEATATPAAAASVAIVAGDRQTGHAGTTLPKPLRVRVLDRFGNPVPGTAVDWVTYSGSGSTTPARSIADSSGTVTATWLLGPTVGTQMVEARGNAVTPARFEAYATQPPVASIEIEPARLTLAAGDTFRLVPVLRDAQGNVLTGYSVTWSSNHAAVASVNQEGLVVARAGDSSIVKAALGGVHELVVVNVPATSPPVAAGFRHTCATNAALRPYCWGSDDAGQLGNTDSRTTSSTTPTPTYYDGDFDRMYDMSSGYAHTCGINRGGGMRCWGSGQFGQVGGSVGLTRHEPKQVPGAYTSADISAGGYHTCTVTPDGEVYCFGSNYDGQLGTGAPPSYCSSGGQSDPMCANAIPRKVLGDVRFLSVAAGERHTCAIALSGAAWCWGDAGALGDGSTSDRGAPGPVSGGLRFRTISAGAGHTCGITTDGATYCWGRNDSGQLGTGGTTGSGAASATPVRVSPDPGFTSLTAGASHTCGIAPSGAYCWGRNDSGQLGTGTTVSSAIPVPVTGPTFVSLAAGWRHTCGRDASGAVYCWGENSSGQLGDGTTTSRSAPGAPIVLP